MHVMPKPQRKTAQLCFRVEPSLAARLRRLAASRSTLGGATSEASVAREALIRGLTAMEDGRKLPRGAR